MIEAALREIAVVGEGVAGWTAAAAVARRVPRAQVSLVPTVRPAPSLLEHVGILAPSSTEFHGDMQLDEPAFAKATGAGHRLGSLLQNWSSAGSELFHGYADHGAAFGGVPFHQIWLRAGSPARFHSHSPAAVAALAGRFSTHRAPAPGLPQLSYGYHVDPHSYLRLMRQVAVAAGVKITPPAVGFERDARALRLRLADGKTFAPDLIVDATVEGMVVGEFEDDRIDWSSHLPCDRLLVLETPAGEVPSLHDSLSAWSAGSHLTASRPGVRLHALTWSAAHATAGRAERAFRNLSSGSGDPAALTVEPGRRRRAWIGNVVAVGEAAVVAGIAEGAQMHLLHAHCDRLITSLPDRDFAEVELADYNRQTAQEADRIRDFLHLGYRLSSRTDQFWRDIGQVAPSDALAYDLELFGERGRLPVHDEETFDRESWIAVLLGLGVRPRRVDALAAGVSSEQAALLASSMRRDLAEAVAILPTYGEYLRMARAEGRR